MKDEALKVANRLQDVIAYLNEMPNIPTEITDRILQAGLTICLLATASKELSDEEIKQLIVQHIQTWNSLDSIIDFARAIIKKASEK